MRQFVVSYRGVLFFILMVAILTAIVLLQWLRPAASPIILVTSTSSASDATATPRPLRVYVSGAVRSPDVYTLPADSIVKDALIAAGGPTDDADLDRINLASPVSDGQHVYVPHLGEENPVSYPSASRSGDGYKININTADLNALESLPGIGPVLAQRILDYRHSHGPFSRPEEIMEVPGIGQATFDKIQDLITTE